MSALDLRWVENGQLEGSDGRQSLQAADVFASDRLRIRPSGYCARRRFWTNLYAPGSSHVIGENEN
jgi:hypothetical protein